MDRVRVAAVLAAHPEVQVRPGRPAPLHRDPHQLADAVAVGGQQHGMVALDEAGDPVRDALLWNDTRSAGTAADLVAEIRAADQRLKHLTTQIERTVAATGSRLGEVDGIGPVITAQLLGRTRRASRFPTAAAFASYAGVAPVEVASADHARHRLPRGGDRQLNHAFHMVALTQIRMPGSAGRAYYDTKIATGKTHNEAMRCLKRRLADHVWRRMIRDERTRAAGPGGHSGATLQSSAAGSTPTTSSSDQSLPEPATTDSTTASSVA